jgi:hypothetical protein
MFIDGHRLCKYSVSSESHVVFTHRYGIRMNLQAGLLFRISASIS